MATITEQTITKAGIVPTTAAVAAGGDQFTLYKDTIIWIKNTHATDPRTFTFVTQATTDGLAVADRTVTITAANDNTFVSDLDPAVYRDANGFCQVTYSDAGADCEIGVFRVNQ